VQHRSVSSNLSPHDALAVARTGAHFGLRPPAAALALVLWARRRLIEPGSPLILSDAALQDFIHPARGYCDASSGIRTYGVTSHDTLWRARKELEAAGVARACVETMSQSPDGSPRRYAYALTFDPVELCGGPLGGWPDFVNFVERVSLSKLADPVTKAVMTRMAYMATPMADGRGLFSVPRAGLKQNRTQRSPLGVDVNTVDR
jgi:hypothetical protein